MRVLAGDVGGTHTRLAVCEVNEGKVLREIEDIQPSNPDRSFKDIVQEFLADNNLEVRASCFGLPGPIRGRRAQLTNLPWVIDSDLLERELGLPSVTLINDLEANAHGLSTLSTADIKVLREGSAVHAGNAGLVSAGTGLGEAGMHFIDGQMFQFATEGGHATFAPMNQLEFDLMKFLQAKFEGHVSWERVVSGPGLANVYEFLKSREPDAEPAWLADELDEGDVPAVIAKHAIAGKNELCSQALEMFFELYGSEAGNFDLKVLAQGGIYLGGGIVPKVAKQLGESRFIDRFNDKGRLRHVVEQIPIRVVLNDRAALQGAALYAARSAKPR